MKKKAIIFDMDGVIIDSAYNFYLAYDRILKEYNINFTFEYFQPIFGQRSDESFKKIEKDFDIKFDSLKETSLKKDEAYKDIAFKTNPVPNFKAVVDAIPLLAKEYKLAIASSSVIELVDHCLNSTKIKDYFEVIISGDKVKKGKPNPEVFLTTLNELQVNKEDAVIIEDAPPGLKAAKDAGMKCIILKASYAKNDWYEDADKILDMPSLTSNIFIDEIKKLI